MTTTPYMQLYISDYIADTQHLSTEQHGAYLLLLMAMWRNGGKLQNDNTKLSRIARVSLRRWHLIANEVMEFFDIEGDIITQKRLVEEYQKATSKVEKRIASGRLGGLAKSLKNNNTRLANASVLPCHLLEPEPDIIKTSTVVDAKKDIPISETVKKKKGSRLPEDWGLSEGNLEYALEKGLSREQATTEAEMFKNYWLSSSGASSVKLDWNLTWNNWVLKAVARLPKHRTAQTIPKNTSSYNISDVVDRVREDLRNERNSPQPKQPDCPNSEARSSAGVILDLQPIAGQRSFGEKVLDFASFDRERNQHLERSFA